MDVVLRATVVYLGLWALTRGLGKRQLSEMTPFEMVVLIVIGDLVQQGVTQQDHSVTGAVLAVATIGLWSGVFALFSWRWQRGRRFIESQPVVLVQDGRVLSDALFAERLPHDELLEAARQNGIADLAQVKYAVLEPGGTISFVPQQS